MLSGRETSLKPDFTPLFRNPHLATIAGNFWKRPESTNPEHCLRKLYRIDCHTTVVAFEQRPLVTAVGEIVFLHGLEGSAHAGYLQSFTQLALSLNCAVHRLNFRSCGGTEDLSATMYHSGLTSDTAFVIGEISRRSDAPVFLVGFSLGGNVAIKLTGEFGANSPLAGTVAISAPIDLASCVRVIDRLSNAIYAHRFLDRLKNRIKRKSISAPETYNAKLLESVHTIWQFDNQFTAPLFGFGNAASYYATQSAINYISLIRSPTLLIAAQDDPLVPFDIYTHPVIKANPLVHLISPKHGGHIGFLSRRKPRFWLDGIAMNWIQRLASE